MYGHSAILNNIWVKPGLSYCIFTLFRRDRVLIRRHHTVPLYCVLRLIIYFFRRCLQSRKVSKCRTNWEDVSEWGGYKILKDSMRV